MHFRTGERPVSLYDVLKKSQNASRVHILAKLYPGKFRQAREFEYPYHTQKKVWLG